MEYITAYDGYTTEAPHEESERIVVVAQEQGKNHKEKNDKEKNDKE
jgi:hypothetical protein